MLKKRWSTIATKQFVHTFAFPKNEGLPHSLIEIVKTHMPYKVLIVGLTHKSILTIE
jgi:hypothetical protein